MRILGIDYGRKKMGLAISESGLAEPWKVIRLEELSKVLETEKFDKIVVGVSEGAMAEETKKFADTLRSSLSDIPVELSDETLTSLDAQRMSREAGIPQKKRHEMEDAYAAAIMLQNYVDQTRGD